jgi:hypothetical protein
LKSVLIFLHIEFGFHTRCPIARLTRYQDVLRATGVGYERRVHEVSSSCRCRYHTAQFNVTARSSIITANAAQEFLHRRHEHLHLPAHHRERCRGADHLSSVRPRLSRRPPRGREPRQARQRTPDARPQLPAAASGPRGPTARRRSPKRRSPRSRGSTGRTWAGSRGASATSASSTSATALAIKSFS